MLITLHANGKPILKWSYSYSHSQYAMILLAVWSENGYGSALTSKGSSNLLNYDTYRCICVGNCVIHLDK